MPITFLLHRQRSQTCFNRNMFVEKIFLKKGYFDLTRIRNVYPNRAVLGKRKEKRIFEFLQIKEIKR